MKLHLGCGKRKIHGWCNVDIDPSVDPDIVDCVEKLEHFTDQSVDIIYACHVLEHCRRQEIADVLKVWRAKLKPGGILRIAVPDFEKVVTAYQEKGLPLANLLGFLVGGQKTVFDYHHMVFDFESLSAFLRDGGFESIERYNWNETDHFYIDDYSSCYLPHLDKGSGLLMSLNVQCVKP